MLTHLAATLTWFSDHIATLRSANNTSIYLHVTRPVTTTITLSPTGAPQLSNAILRTTRSGASLATSMSSEPISPSSEKGDTDLPSQPPKVRTKGLSEDPEKSGLGSEPVSPVQEQELGNSVQGVPILHSKPDISALIRAEIASTPSDQRVLVMGCGPERLMTEVRDITAKCIKPKGPGLELHCEQFGW
jgi:hypothetical protein